MLEGQLAEDVAKARGRVHSHDVGAALSEHAADRAIGDFDPGATD
jgi:hypothetical protein